MYCLVCIAYCCFVLFYVKCSVAVNKRVNFFFLPNYTFCIKNKFLSNTHDGDLRNDNRIHVGLFHASYTQSLCYQKFFI